MTQATITLPFTLRMVDDETGFTYFDHDHVHESGYFGSMAQAKRKLRAQLRDVVNEALRTVENYRTQLLATNDGHVFTVRYRYSHWGYSISGSDRGHSSSVAGRDSFDEALADARRHIDDAFGGVAWECAV